VTNVEAVLDRIPGVEGVWANFGAERVAVEFDPGKVRVQDLVETVALAGYRVEERPEPGSGETEDAEAAARRAEIGDLARRVLVGAVVAAPVLFAVMVGGYLDPSWLPGVLSNRWLQLGLIAPVMGYTGWPVHRTGWLTLRLDTIVLDKTGTITKGEPSLTDVVVAAGGLDDDGLLRLLASAERSSEHPLAQAVVLAARDRGVRLTEPSAFDSVTGKGIRATVAGRAVVVGRRGLLQDHGVDPAPLDEAVAGLAAEGKTAIYAGDHAQHPPEPGVRVRLQHRRHPDRRRGAVPGVRAAAQPHDRRRGDVVGNANRLRRFRPTPAPQAGPPPPTDPVCGMRIDPSNAAASQQHQGQTYSFCSKACHDRFVADPAAYR
jgi:cation transport ATPase/YHS domain-containing protein